jgi:transposase
MQLTDFVRGVPDEVWAVFDPLLPTRVWCGIGRKPIGNRECLHGLLYVLATGIGWEYLPPSFPSYKTIQRRLQQWLALDCFPTAWRQLAQRYQPRHGINGDQILLDGAKQPAKKGVTRRGRTPWTAASAAPPCSSRATAGRCREASWSRARMPMTVARPGRC